MVLSSFCPLGISDFMSQLEVIWWKLEIACYRDGQHKIAPTLTNLSPLPARGTTVVQSGVEDHRPGSSGGSAQQMTRFDLHWQETIYRAHSLQKSFLRGGGNVCVSWLDYTSFTVRPETIFHRDLNNFWKHRDFVSHTETRIPNHPPVERARGGKGL